jgi:hypothetical protein
MDNISHTDNISHAENSPLSATNQKICKYCLEPVEDLTCFFLYPCKCTNGVCTNCLKNHVTTNNTNKCEICLCKYNKQSLESIGFAESLSKNSAESSSTGSDMTVIDLQDQSTDNISPLTINSYSNFVGTDGTYVHGIYTQPNRDTLQYNTFGNDSSDDDTYAEPRCFLGDNINPDYVGLCLCFILVVIILYCAISGNFRLL